MFPLHRKEVYVHTLLTVHPGERKFETTVFVVHLSDNGTCGLYSLFYDDYCE